VVLENAMLVLKEKDRNLHFFILKILNFNVKKATKFIYVWILNLENFLDFLCAAG